MSCVFAVWLWLFHPGAIVGFGSRKEILVDRQGDMNSIFEKIRTIIRRLPHYLTPKGYKPEAHSNYMRLLNPEVGTAIVRGGGCARGSLKPSRRCKARFTTKSW
jgi:phage terminase large subunit